MNAYPPAHIGKDWPAAGPSRVPYAVYADPSLHREELNRLFYRGHWSYVGLAAEVPTPGDFKLSWLGERSVILARARDGEISVVENHCAHRGARFCQTAHGNTKIFVCPYHQWSYDLKGNLQGVPFRNGVKHGGELRGGMPADFKPQEHGLTKLKVEVYNGVVFAAFDHDVPPLRDYLGPHIVPWFERVFDGRALTILGYSRQRIPRQLEADAGEHQGPLSPRAPAHLVRRVRTLARRPEIAAGDGRPWPARRHDFAEE